jgi:hypothetical protein
MAFESNHLIVIFVVIAMVYYFYTQNEVKKEKLENQVLFEPPSCGRANGNNNCTTCGQIIEAYKLAGLLYDVAEFKHCN